MGQPADTTARPYTVAEYFDLDTQPDRKFEFRDGEVLDMAGGTEPHSLISANVLGELRTRVKGTSCRVYDSNLRVRAKRGARYAYPDVLVVCGPRAFDPDDPRRLTVTNPTLVVEVLSPSTERGDRGEKLARCLQCPTLQEYVTVSPDQARVETVFRQTDGTWALAFHDGLAADARLRSLGIDLPLSEVYADVDLPPPAAADDAEA